MSKILVIGGTGLISTAVAQQLCDRGADLTLFNRGRTPSRVRGNVTLLAGDRTDFADFENKVRAAGPWDVVIEMIVSDPAAAESLVRACRGRAGQVIF